MKNKKILYLVSLFSIVIIAVALVQVKTKHTNTIPGKNESFCASDTDCVPFVSECGYCTDYTTAINKKFIETYQERYSKKCNQKEYRSCDALPKGESRCINNTCTLVK